MGGKSAAEKASESVITREIKPFEFRESEFTKSLRDQEDVAQSRSQQLELTEALAARARGEGESLAERQFRASQDRLLAQQQAAQAGLRGRGGALAGRQIARQAAEQQQAGARDAATLRAQEQLGAQQALGSQIQSQRAADISVAAQDRQAQQRLQELQAQQALGAAGLNLQRGAQAAQHEEQFGGSFLDTIGGIAKGVATAGAALSDEDRKKDVKKSEGAGSSFLDKLKSVTGSASNRAGKVAKGDVDSISTGSSFLDAISKGAGRAAQSLGTLPVKAGKPAKSSPKPSALASGIVPGEKRVATAGLGGGIFDLIKSDKDSKASIEISGGKGEDFLDALKAVTFEYKDPKQAGAGDGEQLGIIAQDLEKAGPVGKQMVQDTPEGKMVDFGKGFGAILAAQVELNERLKEVENRKKKRKK